MCIGGAPFCLRWMMTIIPHQCAFLVMIYKVQTCYKLSRPHKTDGSPCFRWKLDADFDRLIYVDGLELLMPRESIHIKERSKENSTHWWIHLFLTKSSRFHLPQPDSSTKSKRRECKGWIQRVCEELRKMLKREIFFIWITLLIVSVDYAPCFWECLTCFVSKTASKWPRKAEIITKIYTNTQN